MNNSSTILALTTLLAALGAVRLHESDGSHGSHATQRAESPFACNRLALTPEERKRHFDDLGPKLRSLKKSVRELQNGYEFEFPVDSGTVQQVTEWALGERACCPFFDISMRLEREGGSLWLGLSGREGVKQFIQVDIASWFRP